MTVNPRNLHTAKIFASTILMIVLLEYINFVLNTHDWLSSNLKSDYANSCSVVLYNIL